MFSKEELEALEEILNMGIGRGAAALSQMCDGEVLLSVPEVSLIAPAEALARLNSEIATEIAGVRQRFDGLFSGDAMLLFPESASLELVRCLIKENVDLESMSEIEHEALCEVGNVILNAVVSAIADELDVDLGTGLPQLVERSVGDLLSTSVDDKILFLRVDFSFPSKSADGSSPSAVKGYVVFVMEVSGFKFIAEKLSDYLERLGAGV